jgi:hypothetical protein
MILYAVVTYAVFMICMIFHAAIELSKSIFRIRIEDLTNKDLYLDMPILGGKKLSLQYQLCYP